jgi:hypothetical protein
MPESELGGARELMDEFEARLHQVRIRTSKGKQMLLVRQSQRGSEDDL